MSCYSCGGNPKTFCKECLTNKDTWIAPVDKLPDTFMGDFDHLYRTPDGNLYALAPERDRWIRVNGEAGNSVSYNDTELKKRITALEGRTDNFVSGIGVSREGSKVKLTYTFIDGTYKEVEFEDKDTKSIAYDDTALKARVTALENTPKVLYYTYDDSALKSRVKALEDKTDKDTIYDDTALKARVKALEDKPAPTISKEPVHRFYNGDIPGAGNPADIKTVSKNNFRNPDGIKAGDTLEDFATDSNSVSRGIWKVLEVDGDNVKVQGIGNYFTNLRKNLTYNPDTKQLSIDGGNTITLPSDKQTISKQGNKLILSNGGGEVDLPQPNNAVAYNDKPLRDRVTALEARPDNDRQTLTLNANTGVLSISGGNSVTIPKDDKPVLRIAKTNITGNAVPGSTQTTYTTNFLNNQGLKVGDIVQDLRYFPNSGATELNYWTVSAVNGSDVTLTFANKKSFGGSKQIISLNGTTLSLSEGGSVNLGSLRQPIHRFYAGDIPGRADTSNTATIQKSNILNNDDLRVGDTIEDHYSNSNTTNRGIWKITEISGDNVKVKGLGNYDINQKQTLTLNGNTLSLSNNGGSVTLPQPNMNGYVPVAEYNKLKGALEKLLTDLKGSGAWRQTGSTVFEGSLDPNRHLATGNINLFGGATDGSSFIRTNNGSTENDLAGGIG